MGTACKAVKRALAGPARPLPMRPGDDRTLLANDRRTSTLRTRTGLEEHSDVSADNDQKIPSGRLGRLARLASLTARTAGDLAVGKAKRALGDDSYSAEKEAAKKVLETLGTMKGAAMKLGQQLAMEVDGLPPEAREIVSKLFAQAPPMSYEQIAGVVQEELGDPPDVVFKEFDRTPLASASLGQVHRAQLQDGTPVAVKVQYPGVAEALVNDLKNASLLVKAFRGAGRAFADLDAEPYYEEIRREIGAETDYVREARLAGEFAAAVRDLDGVRVPRVYAAYSSKRVLAMEYVEGRTLKAFAESDADDEARRRVGSQLAMVTLLPFSRDHIVHADPHPGNFLVRPDGGMTVLDFGAVKRFTPEFVDGFTGLLDAELEDREPDFIALMKRAHYTFKGDLDKARNTLKMLHEIAARPLRVSEYDWGECRINIDFRSAFAKDLRDVVEVQSPPESLLFFRAVGGLANNLKLLRAKADSRAVYRDIRRLSGRA